MWPLLLRGAHCREAARRAWTPCALADAMRAAAGCDCLQIAPPASADAAGCAGERSASAAQAVIAGGEALPLAMAGAAAGGSAGLPDLSTITARRRRRCGVTAQRVTARMRTGLRQRAHRPSDLEHADLHSGRAWGAGSHRGCGGAVHRRRGGSAGVSEPSGADGGAVCGRSVFGRARRADVPDGRPWRGGLRTATIEFLGRNDFQVKMRGLPDRAWRDRGAALRACGRARGGGAGAGGRPRGQAACGLLRGRRGR